LFVVKVVQLLLNFLAFRIAIIYSHGSSDDCDYNAQGSG